MAWDSEVFDTETGFSTETIFTNKPTLSAGELAHCQVWVSFGGGDACTVKVFASPGTDYDILPLMQFVLDTSSDPTSVSFDVAGYYKFQVSVTSAGSDEHDARFRYRKDGVSL